MKLGFRIGCILTMTMFVHGQGGLLERLSHRAAQREEAGGPVEFSFGKDDMQRLDYWRPRQAGSPLVVFVHGGGWKRGDKRHSSATKAAHFLAQGYGFASINYRLIPAVKVEDQAHDVASALAYLVKRAEDLGFDPRRIALMGHSAGAHLAALVGTDPQYLETVGLAVGALRGVVPLDGACYDVPKQLAHGAPLMRDTYEDAFGKEKERQLALSPTHHAAAPNAPSFLILHVRRIDGAAQSRALAEALKNAGTNAEVAGIEGFGMKGHAEINRRLGDPEYAATPVVDEWLKMVFSGR